jgi:hypothetical protein
MAPPMISILSSTLASTTDGYTYGWEPLDGNMSKVRPVDLTIDFGYPEQFGAMWFRYGRRISREHLPTRWRATYGDKPVPRARLDPPDIWFQPSGVYRLARISGHRRAVRAGHPPVRAVPDRPCERREG